MVRRHIGAVALYQYQGLPSEEDEVQMNHELIHDLFDYSNDEILQNTTTKCIV